VSLIDRIHDGVVFGRRVRVLAGHIARLLPPGASVLDVGAGDGQLAALVRSLRPDITVSGVDVLIRPATAIPVEQFDGIHIPRATGSVDVAMLIDVLHHTDDPLVLLREASRVAKLVLIKDHTRDGLLAEATLRFMDDVGNARHGVRLPYNYLAWSEWTRAFAAVGLEPASVTRRLGLYPPPASWLFDRSLHFVATLRHRARPATVPA
jgi:SAM-dependent methyltransferase